MAEVMFPCITGAYNYGLWRATEKDAPSASFLVSFTLVLLSIILTYIIHIMISTNSQYDNDTLELLAQTDQSNEQFADITGITPKTLNRDGPILS